MVVSTQYCGLPVGFPLKPPKKGIPQNISDPLVRVPIPQKRGTRAPQTSGARATVQAGLGCLELDGFAPGKRTVARWRVINLHLLKSPGERDIFPVVTDSL